MTEETLPQLLERRRGIPQRTTLLVAAALVLIAAAGVVALRDPLDGQQQITVAGDPTFNVLVGPGVVERADPRGEELLRLTAGRSRLTVRPLALPPYEGDVAGMLPVYATNRFAGVTPTEEGKARINGAPGYQVSFPGGTDVLLVPDEPGARDGVLLSLRGPGRPLRLALRSFEFGRGRG